MKFSKTMRLSVLQCTQFHLCICLIGLSLCSPSLCAQKLFADPNATIEQVFIPAPRELTRALSKAQAFSKERKYSEAIDSLELVYALGLEEDYFVRSRKSSETWVSVLSQAADVIDNMPKRGRALYEVKFGTQARKMLELAVQDGEIDQVRNVASRFFHTKAGYAATMLLGRHHLDRGEPLPAAISFKRIVGNPEAREIYQPQVQMLLATAWHFAGLDTKARDVLQSFARKHPEAKIGIAGTQVEMFKNDSKAIDWLQNIVGDSPFERTEFERQWALHRGNPQRTAQSQFGTPLISPDWRVPTINKKRSVDVAAQLARDFQKQQLAALPAINPIVVGNSVVMRTPTQVIGVDWTTGKRTWRYPFLDPWANEMIGEQPIIESDRMRTASAFQNRLSQRLFYDGIYGQMSSDGKNVFFADEIGYASTSVHVERFTVTAPKKTNQLVSLSLIDDSGKTLHGNYRWKVGGKDGLDEPKLAGAFFLGPPLPLQDDLYVICEIQQELKLAVLANQTGKLKWTQQLATVDIAGNITLDSVRRLAGATPSFSDGVIVCPTSAGAVVGIDASTHRLLWGFQYPHWKSQSPYNASRKIENRKPGEKWLDGTITISGTSVVLTPVESDSIFCIDLMNGQSNWSINVAREQDLFVAGVYKNNLILAGRDRLRAIRLDDGSEGWTHDFSKHGALTGRGYMSQSHFLFPTSQSKMVKFDLENKKIEANIETPYPLGNLVACQGKVFSSGTDWLSCFSQSEIASKRVAKRLKQDPDDLDSLVLLAQIQISNQDFIAAMESLEKVYRARDRAAVRRLLARAMVGALKKGFDTSIQKTARFEDAIKETPLSQEYLQLKLAGLVAQRRNVDAINTLFALSQVEAGEFVLQTKKKNVRVRWDRAIQSLVQTIVQNATSDELLQIRETIHHQVSDLSVSGTVTQLENLAGYLAKTNLADLVNIELARKHLLAGRHLSAEFIFNDLRDSKSPKIAGMALAGIARIFAEQNEIPTAFRVYTKLAEKYPQTPCWGDLTGTEILNDIMKDPRFSKQDQTKHWPFGDVEVTPAKTEEEFGSQGIDRRIHLRERRWPAPGDLQLSYDSQKNLYIRDATGNILGVLPMFEQDKRMKYSGYYGVPHYLLNGNLMIVVAGYQFVGIDLHKLKEKRNNEAVLWRIDNSPIKPTVANNLAINRLSSNTKTNELGVSFTNDFNLKNRAKVGVTAWAGKNGFCFTRGKDLVCIDPFTGDTIWEHVDTVDYNADCFSSDKHLFVVEERKVRQFSLFDGQEIKQFKLPFFKERWLKFGSRFIAWETGKGKTNLFVYDLETAEVVWEKEFVAGIRAARVGHDRLAVREPDGGFYLLDRNSGEVLFENHLPAAFIASTINVIEDAERYIVGVNRFKNEDVIVQRGLQYTGQREGPILEGPVFCLDKKTGRHLWQTPVMIDKYAFPIYQPSGIPVLSFVRMESVSARAGRERRATTDLVVIDKRDGQILFQEHYLTVLYGYLIRAIKGTAAIRIDLSQKTLILKFTDKPQPPSAPAQTGKFASKKFEPKKASQGVGTKFIP